MPVVNLTSDGLDITVLTFPHEWSASLSLSHRFPGSVTSGQSKREGRRPKGEDLRHKAAVHLVIEGDDAQEFRATLATLGSGWVGLPLWMDQHPGADWAARKYDPQRLFNLTAGTVVATGSALTADHVYAPLLVGHIDELPPMPADSAEVADLTFTLVEDSPWEFRIGINATVAAGTFPAALAPDWTSAPEDKPLIDLEFDSIGDQRERTIDNTETIFRWGQSATFTLRDAAEIRSLLAFFYASEGLRRKFQIPWWFKPGDALAEAPHSTKARFASDALTLDYLSPDLATVKIDVVQVPWELAGVEGEQPEQPPRAYLYRYTYRLPAPQVYRVTNWPRPLARTADGTYAPAPMLHREISDTLDLRNNKTTVDSFHFAGNPLTLWQPNRIEAPLTLEIFAAESWPIDPDLAVLIFTGDVKRPHRDSRKLEAPVVFLAGLLERELPRVRVGPTCNTEIFSRLCGLDPAAYRKTGTLTAADPAATVLTVTTAAADAENTFALGTIEIGAGLAWEKRHILASEPIVGGQLITVDWPVRQAPAGQAVTFIRGCDRTGATCRTLGAAGSWKDRFRGHEHVPSYNLSLPTMKAPGSTGKK
jgi:hypothetical protein